MSEKALFCPSARCEPGSLLLGIVQANGETAFTPDKIQIDEDFVKVARQGRTPEGRFRFASPCRQGGCQRWSDGKCGVVEAIVEEAGIIGLAGVQELPKCSVRENCRWFAQRGAQACSICPLVITELAQPTEAAD